MNKIKFITKLLPLLILFLVFAIASNAVFAQNNQSLFDLSTPIRQEKITNIKETQAVSLLPFTTLIIKPGSFQEDVTLYVYPGAWNNIKTALLNEQSPISSYYFIFKSKNDTVYPSVPLTIESYNNYINTDTFFYPVARLGEIDRENQKNWPGHIRVRTELPVKDPGFIVAANIDLKPNDSSLNPTITASAPSVVLSPSTKPSTAGSFIKQNIYLILVLVVIVILILGITFLLLKGSKKTNT